MGNQLTGLSPSSVLNVEDYLSELSGLVVFEEELCGSRLFKVAKIRSVDGDNPRSLVVKIFPNSNISQLLWRYQAIMLPYCHRINSGYNLLFFSTSYITERCGVLIRDFIDQSLADRLCTRPFLCIEDKRWIAYQLLCAVDQLHSSSTKAYSKNSKTNYSYLCHGDIKAENVLITSWGWVLLADPAPFKPVWLPSDNPSEFTHFFDSSRRRVCYLAPERFVEVHSCTAPTTTTGTTNTSIPTVTGFEATNLDSFLDEEEEEEASMCSEETKNNVHMHINECDNTIVQSTTINESNVLNKECNIESDKQQHQQQQLSVEISDFTSSNISLNNNNNNFPKSESSYLIENVNELSTQLSMTSSPSLILNTEDCDIQNSNDEVVDLKQRTKFMTSSLLDLDCHLTPTMDLFSIGCVLLELFTDGSIAFTLADLLAYRRNDQSRLLKLLKQIPCEHAKGVVIYRQLLFLNIISKLRSESTDIKHKSPDFLHDYQGDQKMSDSSYLSILRLHVQERLVALFSDPNPHVRLALMNTNGLSCLASFFGRSGTNGTLLSHMITFLNDKCKPELRAAFFRQVSPLASLTGAQFVTILRSLLEQGLIDPDDMVIEECLHCLTNLLRRKLLSAPIAVSFLTQSLALTAHPCLRIRQGSVAYITSFARLAVNFAEKTQSRTLTEDEDSVPMVHHFWPGICSPASVYARLVNSEVKQTIFRRPVNFCFTNDAVLLHSLHPPINRTVLEALVFMPNSSNSMQESTVNHCQLSRLDKLNQILKLFQERKSSRAITRSGELPCYTSPNDEFIDSIIIKLKSLGLTELMESQLVNLSSYIINLCQNGRPQNVFQSSTNSKMNRTVPKYKIYPIENCDKIFLSSKPSINSCINPKDFLEDPSHLQWLLNSPLKRYANLLWERLISGRLSLHSDSFDPSRKIIVGRSLILSPSSASLSTVSDNSSHTSTNTSSTNLTTKMGTIGTLVHGEAVSTSSSSLFIEMINPLFGIRSTPRNMFEVQSEMPIWPESRPQGIMLANLQEHRAGMISLATHSSGRLFASCSSGDGTVKLWNCGFWPTESDGYVDQPTTTGNHSSRVNSATSELVQKSSNFKNSELGLAYCLPTRSSWTFNCNGQDPTDSSIKACRGLVWTLNGSCLVTILDGKCLQQIDVATGQSNGMIQLDVNNSGRAVSLKTSTCCQFPSRYNLIQQVMTTGSDTNLIVYATTSNQIVARDLRVPNSSSPVWILKQDRGHGLILSMAVHSFHTWLVTGTSRGHLICWDLRYKRQIAYTEHPYQPGVGILDLQIAETPSRLELDIKNSCFNRLQSFKKPQQIGQTLIIAATDHHNEVTIWDLESSATASSSAAVSSCNYGLPDPFAPVRSTGCLASTWAQPGNKTPLILDSSLPHRSVRSILCLPNNKNVLPFNEYNKLNSQVINLPAIVAGGNDARLRYWNFRKPEDSCILVWAGNDEEAIPPRYTYRSMEVNDVYILVEQTDTPSVNDIPSLLTKTVHTETSQKSKSSNNTTETLTGAFPVSGRLELRESTKGHKNIISDLTVLQAGQAFLVSSSMDGVIKIWR
ncbi:unnamed protein product [Schistosoma turkestanicum]|nr:unnamed protein product [Schistosoma turkestanicum]